MSILESVNHGEVMQLVQDQSLGWHPRHIPYRAIMISRTQIGFGFDYGLVVGEILKVIEAEDELALE